MDAEMTQLIASIAETITSIGILLIWVWAERKDNKAAWKIITELVRLRLRQIEDNEELTKDKDSSSQPDANIMLS